MFPFDPKKKKTGRGENNKKNRTKMATHDKAWTRGGRERERDNKHMHDNNVSA